MTKELSIWKMCLYSIYVLYLRFFCNDYDNYLLLFFLWIIIDVMVTGTLIIWLQLFRKQILCNLQYMYPPIYLSVWWWTSLTCVGISQVSSERYYQCCLPSLISPICFMLWWLHCICFSWHGLFRSQPESSYCPTWNS